LYVKLLLRISRIAKVDNSREVHGESARGLAYVIGAKALKDDLERYQDMPRYQRLVIPYAPGEDPDDGFRSVTMWPHLVILSEILTVHSILTVPYRTKRVCALNFGLVHA
jgi:hypothetical protein